MVCRPKITKGSISGDEFSSYRWIFIPMINFHDNIYINHKQWNCVLVKVMNFHQRDSFSLNLGSFIYVMKFHLSDKFSSKWYPIFFIKATNFHQSNESISKWWFFIKVMNFINMIRCYQSDEFLLMGVISISPNWCISVKVMKFHHIGIIYQQSN